MPVPRVQRIGPRGRGPSSATRGAWGPCARWILARALVVTERPSLRLVGSDVTGA